MKIFLISVCAAIVLAIGANLILTRDVQESAETAFSAASARP
jgi:hypothetical protein